MYEEKTLRSNSIMCYLCVYICLWMYWITQHCDYDVHVLNHALSNLWFEFELLADVSL
jgi:hypothetical protein